jgi:hypothetical protein
MARNDFPRWEANEGQNNKKKLERREITLMKTKLIKSIMAPLMISCVLLPMVAATASGQGTQGGRLEGTWSMQITLNDCAGHTIRSFPTLVAFNSGGTLTEASGGTAPALQTGGKGVWSHTTGHTYAFRFKDFTFNAQNVFTGWVIITGETTVDETGNANAGPATVEVYNASGVLVASLCADAVGTRFEL